MAKYGKKAQETVHKVMKKKKKATLKSGSTGKTVKSRKQAIAIGLAEARKQGAKVPPAPTKSKATKTKAKPKSKAKAASVKKRTTSKKATAKPKRKTARRQKSS